MEWEEKFKAYRDKTPQQIYEEKYGPVVGPWLLEFEQRDSDGQASWRARLQYEILQKHFSTIQEDVPVRIQEEFIKGSNPTSREFIQENLQSHDWKSMVSTIEKRYPAKQDSEAYPDYGPLSRVCYYPRVTYKEIPDWEKGGKILKDIEKIAEFFGYTITNVKRGLVGNPNIIIFEPNKADLENDYLRDECANTGYTIVPVPNSDSVEKNGLRCKNGNSKEIDNIDRVLGNPKGTTKPYKKVPKRIYFTAFPVDLGEEAIRERLQDVCSELGRDWEQVDVYKIDFSKINADIYEDPAMKSRYAFYTYTNIPAAFLKKVHSGKDRREFEDY